MNAAPPGMPLLRKRRHYPKIINDSGSSSDDVSAGRGDLSEAIGWLLYPGYKAAASSNSTASAPPTLFLLVRLVAALLAAGLCVLILIMLAFAALLYPDGYSDPFAPYAALVPGRASALVPDLRACDSGLLVPASDPAGAFRQSFCVIRTSSEDFDRITVVNQDGKIMQVQFQVARLRIIDLLYRWGRPDLIHRFRDTYMLIWNTGVTAHAPAAGTQFSHLLPVSTVLFRQRS